MVLSRKRRQEIVIDVGGELIVVTVVEIRSDKIRIGVDARKHVKVHRREVFDAIHRGEAQGAPK